MNKKIIISENCLSVDEIKKYKSGDAENHLIRRVELHLIDCPLCNDAIEGYELIEENDLTRSVSEINSFVANTASSKINRTYLYSAAALILIVFSSLLYLNSKDKIEQLYLKNFEIYADVTMHNRGSDQQKLLSEAMNYYNLSDFEKAIPMLSEVVSTENSETAKFYKGVALMSVDEIGKALEIFKDLTKNEDSEFHNEAIWYSSLCYLYLKDLDKAVDGFNKLLDHPDYSKQSYKIIDEIKELK